MLQIEVSKRKSERKSSPLWRNGSVHGKSLNFAMVTSLLTTYATTKISQRNASEIIQQQEL